MHRNRLRGKEQRVRVLVYMVSFTHGKHGQKHGPNLPPATDNPVASETLVLEGHATTKGWRGLVERDVTRDPRDCLTGKASEGRLWCVHRCCCLLRRNLTAVTGIPTSNQVGVRSTSLTLLLLFVPLPPSLVVSGLSTSHIHF